MLPNLTEHEEAFLNSQTDKQLYRLHLKIVKRKLGTQIDDSINHILSWHEEWNRQQSYEEEMDWIRHNEEYPYG